MDKDQALVAFTKALPPEKAKKRGELIGLMDRQSSPTEKFEILLHDGASYLSNNVALMTPPEIVDITMSSKSIFYQPPLMVSNFKNEYYPIPHDEAKGIIKAWKNRVEKETGKRPGDKATPPYFFYDEGTDTCFLRKPCEVTDHLCDMVEAIIMADQDDDWKTESLLGLGYEVIAYFLYKRKDLKNKITRLLKNEDIEMLKYHLKNPGHLASSLTYLHMETLDQLGEAERMQKDMADAAANELDEVDLDEVFKMDLGDPDKTK